VDTTTGQADATKPRGRPAGQGNKIKFGRLTPLGAKEKYYEDYGTLGEVLVYGIDEYTEALIDYLWTKPEMKITLTDPVESVMTNINRRIGGLSMSMFRWEIISHIGVVEEGYFPVIVVAKKYKEEVLALPNPYNVEIICLEELDKPTGPIKTRKGKPGRPRKGSKGVKDSSEVTKGATEDTKNEKD